MSRTFSREGRSSYVVSRGLLNKSSGAADVLPPAVLRMPRSDLGEVWWLPRVPPKPDPVRSTFSCTQHPMFPFCLLKEFTH